MMRLFPVLYVGPALGRDDIQTEAVGVNTLRLQAGPSFAHRVAVMLAPGSAARAAAQPQGAGSRASAWLELSEGPRRP